MKQDIIALAAHRFDERGKRFKTLKPFYRNAKEFFLIGFLLSGNPAPGKSYRLQPTDTVIAPVVALHPAVTTVPKC